LEEKDVNRAFLTVFRYQSLWSRHVVPSVIDTRDYGVDMPYFSDDGLYDFQLEVYNYYTKNMQRY